MSKSEDILFSKPPQITFNDDAPYTIEDLKFDLYYPIIVKYHESKVKEEHK